MIWLVLASADVIPDFTSGVNIASPAPMVINATSDPNATLCQLYQYNNLARVHAGITCPLGDAYPSSLFIPSPPQDQVLPSTMLIYIFVVLRIFNS
jgi:hypothetical protein